MTVTLPIGTRSRLSIGHSREVGWWAVRWRKPSRSDWPFASDNDDGPPYGGVREPRVPPLTPRSGAAALPEPD